MVKRQIALNSRTDLLKLIAVLCMTIDHTGAVLYPDTTALRAIGRAAFPIFCYCLAIGCEYTHSRKKYALRLFLASLFSQPFFVLGLDLSSVYMNRLTFEKPFLDAVKWYFLSFSSCNIMIVLLLGALVIWSVKDKRYVLTAVLAAVILFLDDQGWIMSSYGLKGIILMILFWALLDKPAGLLCCIGVYMLWWGFQYRTYRLFNFHYGLQIFAVFSLLPIAIPLHGKRLKIPNWVFYIYYPLHLGVLYVISGLQSV